MSNRTTALTQTSGSEAQAVRFISMTMTYDQVRMLIADALERAATAHEARRYRELAPILKQVDVPATRGEGSSFAKIGIALNFFDGWVEAADRQGHYYDGISQADWPRLARVVATALRTDRDIPVPVVLQHFALHRSVRDPSILARFKRFLGFSQ